MENKKIQEKNYNVVSLDAVHTHTHGDFKGLKKQENNEKGITLIALVITIIVLLILAGVAIVTLTGDNGILNKAQSAKTETDNSQEYEQVKLAVLNSKMSNEGTDFSINKTKLDNELTNLVTDVEKTTKDEDTEAFPWRVTGKTGKYYIIYENGKVEQKSILASDYGAEVKGYIANNSGVGKWRVFYDDGINVYLIADDYVKYDDVKDVKRGTNELYKNTDYKLSFNNVYKDYSGSEWIINNSKAKKWLNQYLTKNPTSTNKNIQAVAYLMDTKIWSDKFGGDQAEYVIGGPTLEIYCASYKETHPDKYIECEAESSSNGYKVKWNGDENYSTYINNVPKDENNKIYINSDSSKAYAMWLSAPSANGVSLIMNAYCNGGIGNGYYGFNDPGLRPLVSLKSNIQFTKNADGSYTIK